VSGKHSWLTEVNGAKPRGLLYDGRPLFAANGRMNRDFMADILNVLEALGI